MPEQATTLIIAGVGIAALILLVFAGMHEKHYRDRRGEILSAKFSGFETRLGAIESILTEDRIA